MTEELKRAKSARKLDTCPLCSGRLTPIHARELLCDDCSSIFQPDVVERYTRIGFFELRNLVAILYCASGCSCCQDTETWNATAEKLGKLLDIPVYDDGSGYDFYTVRDAAIKGEQPKPRESISLPPELKGVDLLADPLGDGESAAFPIGALLKRCRQHIDATRSGSSVERGHSLELLADIDKYLKGEG